MTLPDLFSSPERLRAAFLAGLERQLDDPGLGAFILVLANARFDPGIWPSLKAPLSVRLERQFAAIQAELRCGQAVNHPDDDLLAFLKLAALGFEHLNGTAWRQVGPWEIQFNPIRALRPARASQLRTDGCTPPAFNPGGFQFNKPFLTPEILWQGELRRHPVRLLYNKFPFADLHGILVPDPARQHPQRLSQNWHLYAWHLAESLTPRLPGFGISYNSYGAQASVNHLHFQTFVRERPLPVADPAWRHNGGAMVYPLLCHVFEDALDAWFFIEHLHAGNQPYNLAYTGERLYCLPRKPQGSQPSPSWSAGQAWYELAGGAITANQGDFHNLTAEQIAAELAALAPVSA